MKAQLCSFKIDLFFKNAFLSLQRPNSLQLTLVVSASVYTVLGVRIRKGEERAMTLEKTPLM